MKSSADVFHRVHGNARPLLGTLLYGLVARLAAVAFPSAINWLYILFFKSRQRPAARTFLDQPGRDRAVIFDRLALCAILIIFGMT